MFNKIPIENSVSEQILNSLSNVTEDPELPTVFGEYAVVVLMLPGRRRAPTYTFKPVVPIAHVTLFAT